MGGGLRSEDLEDLGRSLENSNLTKFERAGEILVTLAPISRHLMPSSRLIDLLIALA